MNDCQERILPSCERVIKEASTSGSCPSWNICLPFGGNLHTEGGCIHYDPPSSVPPDGEYTKIVIVNGCIVDAKQADIPLYTASPCAPVPTPCDCAGGGSGSLPDPSPQAGNMFRYDASGRPLVKLTVQSGEGVSVTGSGTANDPLVITNTQEQAGQLYLRSGSAAIGITGDGTASDPKTITHASGFEGTLNGMTFDAFGHLVSYEKPSQTEGVNGVVGVGGINVEMDPNSKIATVSLQQPATVVQGDQLFGGNIVSFDDKNRITGVKRGITVTAGTYAFGSYDVDVNEYGSITEIKDSMNLGNEYVRYYDETDDPGDASTSRTNTFTLRQPGYVRVVYEAVIPAAQKEKYTMRINGRPLPIQFETYSTMHGAADVLMHLESVTQSVMAADTHTIQILSGGTPIDFSKPAKLVATPSWVFNE